MHQELYKDQINYEYHAGEVKRDLIVLVHPSGISLKVWGEVVQGFKSEYDILAIDLPGHGQSPDPATDANWRIPTLAKMIKELSGSLGYESVHYVGTSIGGAIGQELFLESPEFIKSAVITNTHSKIGEQSGWQLRADNVRSIGLKTMAKEIVPRWFAPLYLENKAAIEIWQTALENTGNEGYAQLSEALGEWSATDRLPNRDPNIPVLCIAGSEDPAMPLENMQKLAGLVGGQDLKVMSVGHVPSVEAPDEFNQVLRAWFGNVKA